MPYPMAKFIENTLKGIDKAQRDYERWSGGYWLYQAPEYLMTTYVAKELATHTEHSYYITLEHNTADAVSDAGGMRPGRPRNDLRPSGKFDILLWWGNGTPRAIIEVKKHISQYKHISADNSRMCTVLEQHTTIRHGIMAYYTAHNGEESQRGLRKFLLNRLHTIECETRDYVQGRGTGMSVRNHHKRVKLVADWAWVPGVLELSRS